MHCALKKLAIFASGNGSNFEAIVDACRDGRVNADPAVCVCDKPGAGVIKRAERLGIPIIVTSPRDFTVAAEDIHTKESRAASKSAYETYIADRLDELGIDLVCLAGYMRIISPNLLGRYGGRIINIHPSLLPAFKGAHAIRDAFDYGVKVYGVTVHYVDETLDGGRIIAQTAVPYEGDDIDELETLIHRAEHRLYPEAINRALSRQ